MLRGRRSVTLDLKAPAGVAAALRPARPRRRVDRGLPPRRAGAHGARSGRAARAQSAPRRRPHDRLGPGRPARAARRPRHRLHRAVAARCTRSARRRARRCRRSISSAISAAAACCSASACWPRCSRRSARARGQVVDAAMVEGAALLTTMFWGMARREAMERPARRERARLRRAVVRHLRDARRPVRRDRRDRVQVLRRTAGSGSGSPTKRCRRSTTARAGRRCARGSPPSFANADARRVVRGVRRFRCVLSRRCSRSREAKAHPHNVARGAHVTVGGIDQPAPAPRFSRTPGDGAAPAAGARRAGPRGARRMGILHGGDRAPARRRARLRRLRARANRRGQPTRGSPRHGGRYKEPSPARSRSAASGFLPVDGGVVALAQTRLARKVVQCQRLARYVVGRVEGAGMAVE